MMTHKILTGTLLALLLTPAFATADRTGGAATEEKSAFAIVEDSPRVPIPNSTADHSKFEALQGPFRNATEVTEACLSCHTEAGDQIMQTTHWNWEYQHPETGQLLGKKHELNVFCGSVRSNYPRCTSCHIGYGWEDRSFDFSDATRIDCLVCHDTTGSYVKPSADAGHPAYEDKVKNGKIVVENNKPMKKVDLPQVAQQVGKSSRVTCGNCHFYGGGGDGVKHGDLDSSLNHPDRELDVHMDANGLNFSCATCHTSDQHSVAGSRYSMTARDLHGIDIPGHSAGGRASCESCHGLEPHDDISVSAMKLNDHINKVACQSCHIPEFARGGVATKTLWDWSQATQKLKRDESGKLIRDKRGRPIPVVEYDEHGHPSYMSQKGYFEHGENVVPEYHWFDGQVEYTLMDEAIDPDKTVSVNRISGSRDDPDSRLWPFKRMVGKQPYDKQTHRLLATHAYGPETGTALWSNFDWPLALEAGQREAVAAGEAEHEFSGEFGFVDNEMYWPITHMVAPKEKALRCAQCHSDDGRLQSVSGIYLPGRDGSGWINGLGLLLVGGTLFGVLGHGLLRLIAANRRRV
ncbi:MAG: tetrathionate reductase family octaheme c-type cytochrome [Gammaproteobacteria bacterium]|nr:tetrathionate reductase family octaheme c-type cytochrome [Gammaproteobacteria bacterium]MCW8994164.1 tetrathionate reductase family octaheme c-type cytochrome [Gammaproteobacteria bacterium]